jgi:hypothetical protein
MMGMRTIRERLMIGSENNLVTGLLQTEAEAASAAKKVSS